ncbi:MAG: hypothetical protein ACI85O_000372 [Saprospiraceae bacterium]
MDIKGKETLSIIGQGFKKWLDSGMAHTSGVGRFFNP